MGPERWRRIETIYHQAQEVDLRRRVTFLTAACGSDEALRREVESLLGFDEQAHDFIESPALGTMAPPPDRDAVPSKVGRRIGPYEILALLGRGGMAEVYLARDPRLGRKVALKLLPAEFTRDADRAGRFRREARAASALNHPNIITIHEIGHDAGTHFIVTEFVEGQTLRQLMSAGRVAVPTAVSIAAQVAQALVAAHRAGIVHRDIKPENVMARPDGVVKVLDFGLAKPTERVPAGVHSQVVTLTEMRTDPGKLMGTVSYMSPEQALGERVDERTDLFSLGIMLYELTAGRQPFSGATTSEVIASTLNSDPPPLSGDAREIPAELQWILRKALRKAPDERYQSAEELLADLNALAGAAGRAARTSVSGRPTVGPGLAKAGRPRRGRLAALVALAFAAAGLAGVAAYRPFAGAGTGPHTLAVLPLTNFRPDAETDFLGFSLADAIISELGDINNLTVRPSSFVRRYRGLEVAPETAAAELNVDTLLLGSFLRDGEDLRVTAQLIQVSTKEILWRGTIDVKYDRLRAVHDRVAHEMIRGLAPTLRLDGDLPAQGN